MIWEGDWLIGRKCNIQKGLYATYHRAPHALNQRSPVRSGKVKGLAEGMEKGMNKRSLEIARKMLANGMDAATVMEITGLSESQLQQLKG